MYTPKNEMCNKLFQDVIIDKSLFYFRYEYKAPVHIFKNFWIYLQQEVSTISVMNIGPNNIYIYYFYIQHMYVLFLANK